MKKVFSNKIGIRYFNSTGDTKPLMLDENKTFVDKTKAFVLENKKIIIIAGSSISAILVGLFIYKKYKK